MFCHNTACLPKAMRHGPAYLFPALVLLCLLSLVFYISLPVPEFPLNERLCLFHLGYNRLACD